MTHPTWGQGPTTCQPRTLTVQPRTSQPTPMTTKNQPPPKPPTHKTLSSRLIALLFTPLKMPSSCRSRYWALGCFSFRELRLCCSPFFRLCFSWPLCFGLFLFGFHLFLFLMAFFAGFPLLSICLLVVLGAAQARGWFCFRAFYQTHTSSKHGISAQ